MGKRGRMLGSVYMQYIYTQQSSTGGLSTGAERRRVHQPTSIHQVQSTRPNRHYGCGVRWVDQE